MKTCNKCGQTFPLDMFGKSSNAKDGLKPSCKPCWNAAARKYHHENIDKVKGYRDRNAERRSQTQKIWYAAHKEHCEKRSAIWRAKNVSVWKNATKRWRDSNRQIANLHTRKGVAAKSRATPAWLSEIHHAQISWFYSAAKMMSDTSGIAHNVDHIHALQGSNFSGLHVPWNLRVIPVIQNSAKGNRLPPEDAGLAWGKV